MAARLYLRSKNSKPRGPFMNPPGEEHTDRSVAPSGLFGRYFRVFFAPDLLFQQLRIRPDWAGAWLLGACLVMAGTLLLSPDLLIATMREGMRAQGQTVPPALLEQVGRFRYLGAAAAFIAWGIWLAIFGGVVTVIFAFLLGHEGTYRQYLAVVAHAHLISATSVLLLVPLRIVAEDAQLLLSVGSFAVFLESGYWLRFLSFIDLFGLWAWTLVGLGVARVGRKESWAGGAVTVLMIPVTIAAILAIFTGRTGG